MEPGAQPPGIDSALIAIEHTKKGIANMAKHIILGSSSPRRRELMSRAGFEFTVKTSNAQESYDPSLSPAQIAASLARLKAEAVAQSLGAQDAQGALVVGADTIVALGNTIYGKPADAADACRMLGELSGKTHQVITGVCIVDGDEVRTFAEETDVTFRALSTAEIEAYVADGEPMDKAGAYGIQGEGGKLVDHIDGDFDNVVGLPIKRLAPMLEELLG